jgi:hypothetical protein
MQLCTEMAYRATRAGGHYSLQYALLSILSDEKER